MTCFMCCIFKTLVYLEQGSNDPDMLTTLAYSESEAPSEPCQTSTIDLLTSIIIYANYTYFRNTSFSGSLLYEINIMIFLITGLIFTPEVFIIFKSTVPEKVGGREF